MTHPPDTDTTPSLHSALAAVQAFVGAMAAQPRWRRAFAVRIVLRALGFEAAAMLVHSESEPCDNEQAGGQP